MGRAPPPCTSRPRLQGRRTPVSRITLEGVGGELAPESRLRRLLAILLGCYHTAGRLDRPPPQLPVRWADLREGGMPEDLVRALEASGQVEVFREGVGP